jgi:hypothetical protein
MLASSYQRSDEAHREWAMDIAWAVALIIAGTAIMTYAAAQFS